METQEITPEVEAEKVETTEAEPVAETAPDEKADAFKSEESKRAVLADLAKARAKAKELEEEIAKRDREKLSDIERAQAEAEDFRKKFEAAEQARIRAEVARSKGVDPELLNGSSEDEMVAHAERLLAWRGDKPAPVPNPNPAQGAGDPLPPVSEADQIYNTLYPKS